MALVRVAVAGASGYTGAELVRLLSQHPHVTLTAVTSEKSAGISVSSVYPHLQGIVPLTFEALEPKALAERADVLFLALPHTKSMGPVASCLQAGKRVIDLSADFRLKDPQVYETWYQTAHTHPDFIQQAVYGLPELHRSAITQARLVASPGCYPTAAILQLAPLVAHGLVAQDSIVIDAKSGISGAGRSPALPYHFPEAHESLEPYKIGRHRHIPEIEQELGGLDRTKAPGGITVAFTPHLVPMNRGILSTAYARVKGTIDLPALRALYRDFYKGERFVRLLDTAMPNPRHVRGANYCDLAVHADTRAGWVVTVAALDNLIKGAAGQAIQAMNLMLGYPEEAGLLSPGVYP
ncbi:MAG: N-acetyl-gamma-glutamyl-phosphate reductase [Nitrospirae bacterium]|nr:MAG: n-acetyl-gamma-glutamyl-phosphate reductase [Nitrospira sp. OLB3]MBV6469265.1 N-acetyl-gamma-glutamyl-phosphate reductase [Nitrospirota bacterium]MCK6492521.1 N-acetyl-gamma-glutamyl-phosphate reductase [Nitrospira sp.]MEB2337809.1 N-acetyl-gamma-glutamyl-phosphate reductase [Nitrospirales bacterium]MCK6498322.1 N-acetyl-gamma-glutamyl-phosphate reductase [Nitrospira sp.]